MQQIVDTGALLALIDRRDKYHRAAAEHAAQNHGTIFYLPELIFAETMTLIKSRLGTRMAIVAGQRLRQSQQFIITPVDIDAIWALFAKFDDKAWSFPDCALLVLAQSMGIQTIFSFDQHIDQMPTVQRVPQILHS